MLRHRGAVPDLAQDNTAAALRLRSAVNAPACDLIEPSRTVIGVEHPQHGFAMADRAQRVDGAGEKFTPDSLAPRARMHVNGVHLAGPGIGVLALRRAAGHKPRDATGVLGHELRPATTRCIRYLTLPPRGASFEVGGQVV